MIFALNLRISNDSREVEGYGLYIYIPQHHLDSHRKEARNRARFPIILYQVHAA